MSELTRYPIDQKWIDEIAQTQSRHPGFLVEMLVATYLRATGRLDGGELVHPGDVVLVEQTTGDTTKWWLETK